MQIATLLRRGAMFSLALAPSIAHAQVSSSPVDPCGKPQADSTLTGRGATLWAPPPKDFGKIDFLKFDSNDPKRWYPASSFDGGRTFTRDPGAFSGRADRAHAARAQTANEYRAHQALAGWQPSAGPILLRGEKTGATGLTSGPFTNGRAVLTQGGAGYIAVDVLRAEGGLSGDASANARDGLLLSGNAGARLTLAGSTAQTAKAQAGSVTAGLDAQATGRVFAGTEVTGTLNAAAGPDGARGRLGGELFAGAKAGAEVPVGLTLFGVRGTVTPRADVRAGVGLTGNVHLSASKGVLRVGCYGGGCVGVGGAGGADYELDVTGLLKALDALGGGYRAPEDFKPRVIGPDGNGGFRVSVVNCIGSRIVQRWSKEQVRRVTEEQRRDRDPFSALGSPSGPRTGAAGIADLFSAPSGDQTPRHSDTRATDAQRAGIVRFLNTGSAGGAGRLRE